MNLEISGLVQRFGTTTVLDRLELSTGGVRSLVLVGPSGGGKSTLLRILAGLDVPVAGSVAFDGVTLSRDEPSLRAYRRTVGTVFQAYNLFPHLTAMENLLLPLVHYLLATPPGYPYITTASNFFASTSVSLNPFNVDTIASCTAGTSASFFTRA